MTTLPIQSNPMQTQSQFKGDRAFACAFACSFAQNESNTICLTRTWLYSDKYNHKLAFWYNLNAKKWNKVELATQTKPS